MGAMCHTVPQKWQQDFRNFQSAFLFGSKNCTALWVLCSSTLNHLSSFKGKTSLMCFCVLCSFPQGRVIRCRQCKEGKWMSPASPFPGVLSILPSWWWCGLVPPPYSLTRSSLWLSDRILSPWYPMEPLTKQYCNLPLNSLYWLAAQKPGFLSAVVCPWDMRAEAEEQPHFYEIKLLFHLLLLYFYLKSLHHYTIENVTYVFIISVANFKYIEFSETTDFFSSQRFYLCFSKY